MQEPDYLPGIKEEKPKQVAPVFIVSGKVRNKNKTKAQKKARKLQRCKQ